MIGNDVLLKCCEDIEGVYVNFANQILLAHQFQSVLYREWLLHKIIEYEMEPRGVGDCVLIIEIDRRRV